jgi:hypothetical protein
MIETHPMPIEWKELTPTVLRPYLTIVQVYCKATCDPIFRSERLAELARRVLPNSCHTQYSPEVALAFDHFNHKRLEWLTEASFLNNVSGVSIEVPLLVVNWSDSLFDGACSPLTHGYIDNKCIPGWDTWVCLITLEDNSRHALVCWISPELFQAVDDAILVDAARCMSWLTFDQHSKKPLILGWGKRWEPLVHH